MSGIKTLAYGSDVFVRFVCLDEANDPQDPDSVTVTIDPPDADPTTYTYPSVELTRLDVGSYQLVYRPATAGDYVATVITDDTNPALQKEQPVKFAVSAPVTSP